MLFSYSLPRLVSRLTFVFVLALAMVACDTVDPDGAPPSQQPTGDNGGTNPGDNTGEPGGDEEPEDGEEVEGELGGSFNVSVAPISTLLGGVSTEFFGSAVFFSDSESGRTVMVFADDAVVDAVYPFEFVVFSTPEGLPVPGTYPLSLDTEASFMGGYVELREAGLIDVKLPFQDEVFELPPSSILQTFSGELVITESSDEEIRGRFSFKGFPVDSEFPPLYVLGETRAEGTFRAVEVSEEDAPDIDIDLYLPEEFDIP